jgi:uncharacterized protein YbjT (DUF2867 family)
MLRCLAVFLVIANGALADVLVTGATGRTGSLMYKKLKGSGLGNVRALVHSADHARSALGCNACDESEGIYVADVRDASTLSKAFKGVNTLVDAVGAHGDEDEKTIEAIEWLGVQNQMTALLDGGKDGKRVLMFSSMSTTPAKQHNKILFYKAKAEAYVVEQGVPFTIVKPCGLSEDEGSQREILISHDDTEDWFQHGFYMIPRADIVTVAAASLSTPPADKVRFDICAKLPGSGSLDKAALAQVLKEAAEQPWKPPSASVVV